MLRTILRTALLTSALPLAAAHADAISGSANGLTWTAQNNIVGQTSTATLTSNGNPIYAAGPAYSGVVALIMNEGAAGTFICSGSLLSDRRSILTAGHCVSHGDGSITPISTTAYFTTTANPDSVVPNDPTSVAVSKPSPNSTPTRLATKPDARIHTMTFTSGRRVVSL